MKSAEIKVFAPASVSNLGCGFDVFGMAIDEPGDFVTVRWNKEGRVVIRKIEGAKNLPFDASQNTAGVAAMAMLQAVNESRGVDISIQKKMPLGSGLGSSAASAAAAVTAVNILLGKPFDPIRLVPFAMEGERAACGAAHADNVAPSLLGGLVLVRSLEPLDILSLPVPAALRVAVVHPDVELLTRESRAVLGKSVDLPVAVRQWANTAAFVAALYEKDYSALGHAVKDYVAEPLRAPLIPAFNEVKRAALEAGALACSISGSGPSVFALCKGPAQKTADAMRAAFRKAGIKATAYVSGVNQKGARRIAH